MHTIYADLQAPCILDTRVLSTIWDGAPWSALGMLRCTEEPDPPLLSPHHMRVLTLCSFIATTNVGRAVVAA